MIGLVLRIISRKDRILLLCSYYWPSTASVYKLFNIDSITLLAKSVGLTVLSPQKVYHNKLSISYQDQTFWRVPKWRMFNLFTAHFLQRFLSSSNPKLIFEWRDALISHCNENSMQTSVPWVLPKFVDGCKIVVSKM